MKKRRKPNILAILLFLCILIGVLMLGSYLYNKEQKRKILSSIENEIIDVNNYYLYGTHFNVEGQIKGISINNIKDVKFTLVDISENEKEYDAIYEIDGNKLNVATSKLINEGIYLEDIESGEYFLFLKITYLNNESKYYSMRNNTSYEDLEYYTITKNKSNKKINIEFDIFKSDDEDISYIKFSVAKTKLPASVYDISIDPGHGGSDPGAISGQYKEAEIAMKHCAELKEKLENLGLKVILTRDGTEDTSETSKFGVYSVYDFEGRVNIVGRAKVKYNFSVHVNSFDTNTLSGTEIYAPSNASLKIAQSLADNIVNIANTAYSTRNTDKVSDGVYVRTFTEAEIAESAESAEKKGFEPYNITTSTPYLYMIREVGGKITGAYIDGRNKGLGTNMYYNSNIGVESYLIELGYIINKTDLNNMLNNQTSYVQAITKSIKEYVCKE